MAVLLANGVAAPGLSDAVAVLASGGHALDAVEAGIRPVEADPTVRSVGVGGWTNLLGEIELDAAIMDGRSLAVGAVGALRDCAHPISVARQVMERLPHVLLVGGGAARFAVETGAPSVDPRTEASRNEWSAWLERRVPADVRSRWPDVPLAEWSRWSADPERAGTTVFLALDAGADIAAGVSTCGWAFKYPGRLGDSAVAGAGIYADNAHGAAACTGTGELALRASTARSIVLYMKCGMPVADAVREAAADLRRLERRFEGGLTMHAIDRDGEAHVLSIGLDQGWEYWLWRSGDPVPTLSRAALEGW